MEEKIDFDVIGRDFGLTREQDEAIINFIHSLTCDGASRKRIYNEIMTKNFTRKQSHFAFLVMGFYEALRSLGVIVE